MGDTAEMWGEMLGLGPVITALKDPQFFVQVNQLFHGLIELDRRTIRLERKLDLILEALNVDVASAGIGPAFSEGNGAAGTGPTAPASGAADDGNSAATRARLIA